MGEEVGELMGQIGRSVGTPGLCPVALTEMKVGEGGTHMGSLLFTVFFPRRQGNLEKKLLCDEFLLV